MSHVCVCGPLYLAGPVVALDLPHRTVGICWYKCERVLEQRSDVAGAVLALASQTCSVAVLNGKRRVGDYYSDALCWRKYASAKLRIIYAKRVPGGEV